MGLARIFIGLKCPWICDEDEDTLNDGNASAALG